MQTIPCNSRKRARPWALTLAAAGLCLAGTAAQATISSDTPTQWPT